jgi:hypothetical protein
MEEIYDFADAPISSKLFQNQRPLCSLSGSLSFQGWPQLHYQLCYGQAILQF